MPQKQRRNTDPDLTRTGILSHPGSFATAAAAILFGLYVFNVGGTATFLDNLFSNANQSVQSKNDQVVSLTIGAVPYVVGGIALLFLLFIASWMRKKIRLMQRRMRFRKRHSLDIHEFVTLAKQHGISPKVAMQTYRVIKPSYEGDVRAHINDELREHLHLKEADVEALRQRLLHFCDRKKPIGGPSISELRTIGDLMKMVESAPHHSLTQSMARRIRGEEPDTMPAFKMAPAKDLGETRMVVPLHKRIQQMEKAAESPSPAKTSAPKPLRTPPPPPAGTNASGEFIKPLHKRF